MVEIRRVVIPTRNKGNLGGVRLPLVRKTGVRVRALIKKGVVPVTRTFHEREVSVLAELPGDPLDGIF